MGTSESVITPPPPPHPPPPVWGRHECMAPNVVYMYIVNFILNAVVKYFFRTIKNKQQKMSKDLDEEVSKQIFVSKYHAYQGEILMHLN